MSQIKTSMRHGAPTNASLRSDLAVERSVLSRAVADVETSARKMARLVTTRGATKPVLGYHGSLVYPEAIDHEALAAGRDEALRDAQRRLGELQDLIAGLIETR